MPSTSRSATTPLLETEWLLTDGHGGFAMGTALGVNTRRYHGLLVAALRPPVKRMLVLHSLVEQLAIGADRRIDLWTHAFGDDARLAPANAVRPISFVHDPPKSMSWRWNVEGRVVTRTLKMVGAGCVSVRYTIENADANDRLAVRPLVPLRSFHALDHEADTPPPRTEILRDGFHVQRDGAVVRLTMESPATIEAAPEWWHDFAYTRERERGQDWREDVFSPGRFIVEHSGELQVEVDGLWRERVALEPARDEELRLSLAADQFIVRRDASWSIIAGYPWFADWGRDAMIALPGLLLRSCRHEVARSVLETFARHMRDGLIPNRFDDEDGPAHYNTVDASLWFVHAVGEYTRHIGECPTELASACIEIVNAYRRGTLFDIRLDADGLITAGDETTQLTWMDAKRDGIVFTPRHGKAVEINALWHHALHVAAMLTPSAASEFRRAADQVRASFTEAFWWAERGCLHDVLMPDGDTWRPDGKVRPNQIFAVSLRPGLLSIERERRVVDVVQDRLLTPYGLRTLDPADPSYRGRYEGDLKSRDAAYHNGTVWPWLIGPFCDAYRHVNDDSASVRSEIARMLGSLQRELDTGCYGQIAEIYDGDAPHRPSGCPAQAWSVAEVSRQLALARTQ